MFKVVAGGVGDHLVDAIDLSLQTQQKQKLKLLGLTL
jgi:hypothetical protein